MAVDNELYNHMSGTWWDEKGFLNILTSLNRARFGYFRQVLLDELKIEPKSRRVLDIGCGGGLVAEEFARLGCQVTGIDPSSASLEAARVHAARIRLDIKYRLGTGEAIPSDDASFDIAYCCDVLEHVNDLDKVIAETARALRPGGIYLYDTINRTFRSKLIMIKLFQEWDWTSFMPPRMHDWQMFIKPAELCGLMGRYGLESRGLVGLKPSAHPIQVIRTLRKRKRGEITYTEAGRQMNLSVSKDTSVMYMGYGIKNGLRPAVN